MPWHWKNHVITTTFSWKTILRNVLITCLVLLLHMRAEVCGNYGKCNFSGCLVVLFSYWKVPSDCLQNSFLTKVESWVSNLVAFWISKMELFFSEISLQLCILRSWLRPKLSTVYRVWEPRMRIPKLIRVIKKECKTNT